MHIPVASGGPGWGEQGGEKSPGLRAIGTNPERGFPAVFRQSDNNLGVVFTGWESGGFTGFSGKDFGKRRPNRACLKVTQYPTGL
jgi:hypothetical protein